jgi:coproporphyrinogen III oxidase-like Fe-S oxidoreductase
MDWARASGFEHYEISNFARPGYRAVHNSGYWADMNYLGCGPAAHSFNGRSRRWNLPDLKAYIAAGGDTTAPSLHGEELLDRPIRYDETVMKRLRTREGISLPQFAATFGPDAAARLLHDAQKHIEGGRLELTASGDTLRLTRDGIFVSDDVMSDLFISEN